MRLALQQPVGHGVQVVETRAHVGEEAEGALLVAPELEHAGQAVEDVGGAALNLRLQALQGLDDLLRVLRLGHTDDAGLPACLLGLAGLVEVPEYLVAAALAGGEAVDQHKPPAPRAAAVSAQDGLRGAVEADQDDAARALGRAAKRRISTSAGAPESSSQTTLSPPWSPPNSLSTDGTPVLRMPSIMALTASRLGPASGNCQRWRILCPGTLRAQGARAAPQRCPGLDFSGALNYIRRGRAERWLSGRKRRFAKPLRALTVLPGFESLPLRQRSLRPAVFGVLHARPAPATRPAPAPAGAGPHRLQFVPGHLPPALGHRTGAALNGGRPGHRTPRRALDAREGLLRRRFAPGCLRQALRGAARARGRAGGWRATGGGPEGRRRRAGGGQRRAIGGYGRLPAGPAGHHDPRPVRRSGGDAAGAGALQNRVAGGQGEVAVQRGRRGHGGALAPLPVAYGRAVRRSWWLFFVGPFGSSDIPEAFR